MRRCRQCSVWWRRRTHPAQLGQEVFPVDKLQGTLSCFDRVLFRGYLPFFSGYAMACFPDTRGIRRQDVKRFVLIQASRLKDHARQMAARAGRPYQ